MTPPDYHDESIPDEDWWFSSWSEFEDFVGLPRKRVKKLAENLQKKGVSKYSINRLLAANKMGHGRLNTGKPTRAERQWELRNGQK